MTNGLNGARKTQPFVLRAQMLPGLRWALSVDDSGNFGQPISREYDLPAFSTNGKVLTNQHAMRRGIIMTEAGHRRLLRKRYPGSSALGKTDPLALDEINAPGEPDWEQV